MRELPAEIEKELAIAASNGDKDARERLIISAMPLVVRLARKYSRYKKDIFEDLVGQGNIGITEAVDRFDPNRGYRLSTYATWRVKKNFFDYFDFLNIITLPEEKKVVRKNVYGIITEHFEKDGKRPKIEQIKDELNKRLNKDYTTEEVREIILMYEKLYVNSLNAPRFDDLEIGEFIEGEGPNALERISGNCLYDRIRDCIEHLELDDTTKELLIRNVIVGETQYALAQEKNMKLFNLRKKLTTGKRALRISLAKKPDLVDLLES
jgi:RNA polymerase primary sigma factor